MIISWLWLVWLIPAPLILYFFLRYLLNRKKLIYVPNGEIVTINPFIIFQFASKDGPPIVQAAIDRIHSVCSQIGYTNYTVEVVIDKNVIFNGARSIVVPLTYITKKDTKAKARSLQYATDLRKERGVNGTNVWILHLDEESFITKQMMLAILEQWDKLPPVTEGPIFYPNKFFQTPLICRAVESLRPYFCHDCVSQLDGHHIPTHMHGSNLLVRADIEDEIGWDFNNPASEDQRFGHEIWAKTEETKNVATHSAEDQRFASEAWARYGKGVFGWHGGILEEQPPLTVGALIRQRRRWFTGNLFNLKTDPLPLLIKAEITIRWIAWMTGFISLIVTAIGFLFPYALGLEVRIPFLVITTIWLASYQLGLVLNLRSLSLTRWQRLFAHLKILVITPIAGAVDTYSAFTAPFLIKKFVWVPTEK